MNSFLLILESILYYPIFGQIPFLVLWLALASLFFTLKLNFINFRLFKHGFQCAFGKFYDPDAEGKILPRQSALIGISSTVGLGNIAGVAIAITLGGPGAVLWMVFMGFLGMSTIFAETLMSQKYRIIDKKNDTVYGGPFIYLKQGLSDLKLPKLGKYLSYTFSIFAFTGFLVVAMFQSNQLTSSFVNLNIMPDNNISIFGNSFNIVSIVVSITLTIISILVLIGGVKRIAKTAESIVPFMGILYITCCLIILFTNSDKILSAITIILSEAFNFSAASGGFVGALIAGVKRAAYSNEAGIGTAPIAHAAAKSLFPARQASVAMLNPFIDTVIICAMTGITVVTTGSYLNQDLSGVEITAESFRSVAPWFVYFLTLSVTLFSFSTIVSYSYYSKTIWSYYIKKINIKLFFTLYCLCIFIGCLSPLETIIRLGDNFFMAMAIPNLIGMYFLSSKVKREAESYVKKLKSGDFKP
jgi:AGCS family alanine or glycine:cation symporter